MYKYDKELLDLISPNFDLCRYSSNNWFDLDLWFNNIYYRNCVRFDMVVGNSSEALIRNRQNIGIAIYPAEEGLEINADHELVSTAEKDNVSTWLNFPKHFNGGRESFASIYLPAPDDVLTKAFLSWVHQQRQLNGIESEVKPVTKSMLGKWREARVLEYIDLKQWLELNKIDATYGQLGSILFPDDKRGGVGERVRKTTEKWADLFNNRFIMSRLRCTKWKEN